jgi:predicted dehydrogenase
MNVRDEFGERRPVRYVVVGSGWRAQYYLRPGSIVGERLGCSAVVSRSQGKAEELANEWSVPQAATTIRGAIAHERPDFIVVCVAREHAASVIEEALDAGMPVLCETPPAADLSAMRRLWDSVGTRGLVQVAEQYHLYPDHAARQRIVDSGLVGDVGSVQVSSTHLYHAMSLMRRTLGVGLASAVVSAHEDSLLLADPRGTSGWSGDDTLKSAVNTVAHVKFATGQVGMYDFTTNQWWNPLRRDRMLIRGSRGEILNGEVTWLADPVTVASGAIRREQTGLGLDLEGFDLAHLSFGREIVYRNRWFGARLSDEEIAVCDLLDRMGTWCRDAGPPPYPLAEGSHDHALGLAVVESARRGGEPVTVQGEPWCVDPR